MSKAEYYKAVSMISEGVRLVLERDDKDKAIAKIVASIYLAIDDSPFKNKLTSKPTEIGVNTESISINKIPNMKVLFFIILPPPIISIRYMVYKSFR